MKNKLYLILIFCAFKISHAQKSIDKILITEESGPLYKPVKKQYIIQPIGSKYGIYYADIKSYPDPIKRISEKEYMNLINEIYKTGFETLSIACFGIDKEDLKMNAEQNIQYILTNTSIWSREQRQLVIKELKNISNYNSALHSIIQLEGKEMVSQQSYKVVELALIKGKDTLRVKSNPLGLAYRIPWQFGTTGKKSYNLAISSSLKGILPQSDVYTEPNVTKDLFIRQLVREIFDSKCREELYSISPKQFSKEINELNSCFSVIQTVEYGIKGVYDNLPNQVFSITLKNEMMKKNVSIRYMVSRQGNTLYSRDSLKKDYKNLINRVQSVKFLMDFLSIDTARFLDIYYFDNKPINNYLINAFNTNPEQWKLYENQIASLQEFEEENEPEAIGKEAMKRLRKEYCGCNLRIDESDIQKTIMFELTDEKKNTSTWFLLPDGTPVVFYFKGDRCYQYSPTDLGTNGKGIQYACVKLDKQGRIIK